MFFKHKKDNQKVVTGRNVRTVMTGRKDKHLPYVGEDWAISEQYGDTALEGFREDVADKSLTSLGTAPTPFNRMELAKMAFEYVVDHWRRNGSGNNPSSSLDGTTPYHELISECFDVGELFFHFQQYENVLELIEWGSAKDLENLKKAHDKQKYFGTALGLFFDPNLPDSKYPSKTKLADIERIYLLNFHLLQTDVGGNNILGGTSPYTFFFAVDGNKSNTNFIRGERVLFRKPVPLYIRDNEAYLKFWFALKTNWENLANDKNYSFEQRFPALNAYLDMTLQVLTLKKPEFVKSLEKDKLLEYWNHELRQLTREIFKEKAITLRQAPEVDIAEESGFRIVPSQDNVGQLPLVLPIDEKQNYNRWIYIDVPFNEELAVSISDSSPLEERRLPGGNVKYPYLTEGDFFYDKLLVCELPPSSDYFFGRGYNGKNISVLPPIKPRYFDYFTTYDIKNHLSITVLDEKQNAQFGRIIVELDIPTKNGKVHYRRVYNGAGDEKNREFPVVTRHFVVGIYPFIHISTSIVPLANYRVLLANLDLENRLGQSARFFPEVGTNNNINPISVTRNAQYENANRGVGLQATTYKVPLVFDYIELTFEDNRLPACGIVIPNWSTVNTQNQKKTYSFAIDFGTSNTHVEGIDSNTHSELSVLADTQFQLAFKVDLAGETELRKVLRSDYFPQDLERDYKFPIQTVLNSAKNTEWNKDTVYLGDTNVPYCFGKFKLCEYDQPLTNLKWRHEEDAHWQIKSYLSCLLYQLRNYVLKNDGSLSETKIIRFFPMSMPKQLMDMLDEIWRELYLEFFGENHKANLFSMTESLAPFYYHCLQEGANGRFLCIDIGGETSDVVYSLGHIRNKDEHQFDYQFVTSFRFASGALYGDGYNKNITRNGFVKKFDPVLRDCLEEKVGKQAELYDVYEDIKKRKNSMDLLNFFFSLDTKTNDKINFARIIQDPKHEAFKAVYVIYYAAIIYHLAQMLKAEKGDSTDRYTPNHIAFTGNGAKAFQLLDKSEQHITLQFFTECIFEYVLKEGDARIQIMLGDNPKEKLCKGGLLHMQDERAAGVSRVLKGDRDCTILEGRNTTYNAIQTDDVLLDSVLDNVDDFYEMLLNNMNNPNFSYEDFGTNCRITLEQQLKEERGRREQQRIYLNTAIAACGLDREVKETLFFFPIKGSLSEIAERIADNVH